MTAPDLIELRGLRAVGTHGVLPEERQRAQPFEVDLDLEVDLRRAGSSDNLTDTVDYGAVASAVVAVVAGEHCHLLERLADRIARAALLAASAQALPGSVREPSGADRSSGQPAAKVEAVTVTVRKLRPPVPVQLDSAAVRISRRAEELA